MLLGARLWNTPSVNQYRASAVFTEAPASWHLGVIVLVVVRKSTYSYARINIELDPILIRADLLSGSGAG